MVTIQVTDRDGAVRSFEAPLGVPLMEALRDADFPVDGTCGGVASCGTCHIYVHQDWLSRLPDREAAEVDMLNALASFDETASRLACQIRTTGDLEGLKITVAPGEY